MASQTEENYLKRLYSLAGENGEVTISELSASLRVSTPTANSMVKNLHKQGLVNYEKYKPLSLTELGETQAALIIRKHRLTEMYLVEKMGFGWEDVHEIAEQVEHIDSPAFFERMDEILEFPSIDPHGSPIPDQNGKVTPGHHLPLSELGIGDSVQLVALAHSSSEFLKFLNGRELSLGTELEIKFIEFYDGSMVVSYAGHPAETFTRMVCENLLMEKVSD
jgi:DtxR family Mn-dependent transcriptional regulator